MDRERDLPVDAVEQAATSLSGRVVRTPMLANRTAVRLVEERQGVRLRGGGGTDEARLFLKAEHLQVTGSFKPRGACNRVGQLSEKERARGLITLSAGNHAQAVAYAAASEGMPVTVVMPEGASRSKAAAAAGYGAKVVLYGSHVGETWARMDELREAGRLFFLHPFDDPGVIAGQGTVGREILEDLPEVDVVVVGVGGGGLLSGVAVALKRARPGVRVYGVEPTGSRAMSAALEAGEIVPVTPISIADGLGAPFAGSWTLPLVQRYVDAVLPVEEAAIAGGVRFALERMKQLLEPAGAAALGAVLAGVVPLRDGDTVCVVASGGNVDLDRLPDILRLAEPAAEATLT